MKPLYAILLLAGMGMVGCASQCTVETQYPPTDEVKRYTDSGICGWVQQQPDGIYWESAQPYFPIISDHYSATKEEGLRNLDRWCHMKDAK